MIIIATPLRLSFGGGGTDFRDYYQGGEGLVLSTTIDKYIYVMVKKRFDDLIVAHYRKTELVNSPKELKHELFREALKMTGIDKQIEISTTADIPGTGTGLGSSSTLTVGLLHALYTYKGDLPTKTRLAQYACLIEIQELKSPIGKQDQYAAAYGGINLIKFLPNDDVIVEPVHLSPQISNTLEQNLLLFYTGIARSSSQILSRQKKNIPNRLEILDRMKQIAKAMEYTLQNGDIDEFGKLLDIAWKLKRQMTKSITNPIIDEIYDAGVKAGALGGKLCLVPNTRIKCESGTSLIKDIQVGDKIYDHRYLLQKVSKIHKRIYQGPILEFSVKGLKNPIVITPEHPIFTTIKNPNNQRYQGRKIVNLPIWKYAQEFKKGEVFLIPINESIQNLDYLPIPRDIPQSKYSRYNIYNNIPKQLRVDHDLLTILGWYVAEGCSNKKQFQFTLGPTEINEAMQIQNSIKRTFRKETKITQLTTRTTIVGSSVVISKILKNLCGQYTENKKIPKFIICLPKEKQGIFIRSLWKGDGCIRGTYDKRTRQTYTRCFLKTTSYKLAEQTQEICFRLGFISTIRQEKPIVNRKQVYVVDITGDDARAFSKFIKTGKIKNVERQNNKMLSLRKEFVNIDGLKYVKRSIININKCYYHGLLFNLSVENSNSYIAEDIAVHNCGAGGGGFMLFYCPVERQTKLREALKKLQELPFQFDKDGSKVIFNIRR